MNLNITHEKQNPLFKRKEIQANIEAEIVPSKQETAKMLSKKFAVPEDAVRIIKIQGAFGTKIFNILANIYPSKEELDKIEIKTKKEKGAKTETAKKTVEVKN